MLKPRALQPGDRLAVVSPASPFKREEFDQGIDEIRRLGFEPVYDDTVFAHLPFVSGPPEVRAAAIANAWKDRSIAGLIGVLRTTLSFGLQLRQLGIFFFDLVL